MDTRALPPALAPDRWDGLGHTEDELTGFGVFVFLCPSCQGLRGQCDPS